MYFNQEPDTKITVYKVLYHLQYVQKYITPWRAAEAKLNSELVAFNLYDKGYNIPVKNGDQINGGVIHCWRDLKSAIEDMTCDNEVVVECTARIKDFVAIGIANDICFTKIFVTDKILCEWTEDLVIKQKGV